MVDLNKDKLNMGEWHTGSDIRSEWHLVEIGGIAQVVGGSTPSTKDPTNFGGDIPWITPKDLSGPHDRYVTGGKRNLTRKGLASCSAKLVPPGTVLLTTRAPVGYVAIAGNQIATNQGFRNLILRDGVSPGFVYYWLKANTEELLRHASGSTFTELSGSSLKQIHMLLPEESEQRAIAHILGTLDDKIELNRRMNETLEEMARAIFKSWFVDFDPVRAKMDGSWRRGESLPGMPAEMYDLFPERLVDSELGDIPEGWEVKMLGDLSHKPQYGYTASAKNESVGPKFLRITDINKKAWIEWGAVPYCEITDKDFDKYRLHKDNILIARMADPGHGVMIEEDQEAVFASYLIRFRPKYKKYARFLQYWLRSNGYWELVYGRGIGTTRTSLNAKILSEFPLIVPFHSVILEFAQQIEGLRDRVVANTLENENLVVLRDTLLPKLISGELRVGDAEKFMESVV